MLHTNVNNYWRGHWIRHPAQTNLHGLPTDLLVAIIKDYVAAHQNPPPEIRNYADWLVQRMAKHSPARFPWNTA